MIKKYTILLSLGLWINIAFAQVSIVLQKSDAVYTSHSIDSIMAHAENGNSIYLPGGVISLNRNLVIDKKLNIYGVGHYPDSCAATYVTYLTGRNIIFAAGSTGTVLSGIVTDQDVYLNSTNNDDIKRLNINRCKMRSLIIGNSSSARNTATSNIQVEECVIEGGVAGGDAFAITFTKNIINGQMRYFVNGGIFENNVLLGTTSSYGVFRDCVGLNINNNIITRGGYGYLSGSIMNNNLFGYTHGDKPYGNHLGSGNIDCVSLDSIFVNVSSHNFSYDFDFHLSDICPGKNAATDGYDVGIYGTDTPYKEAAVPVTPHVAEVKVAKKTTNGLLPVEIKVTAQDR